MQAEGTPEISGKDEKPPKGTHNQREQIEQRGKRNSGNIQKGGLTTFDMRT